MTVKKLSSFDKEVIAQDYLDGNYTQFQLADQYQVSPRTIKRVLDEMGVSPVWVKYDSELNKCIKVIKKYQLTTDDLVRILDKHFQDTAYDLSQHNAMELARALMARIFKKDSKPVPQLSYNPSKPVNDKTDQ